MRQSGNTVAHHLLVEVDRVLVPVEDRPLEASALPLERECGELPQHLLAESLAAHGRLHVQVFQVQPSAWRGRSRSYGRTAHSRQPWPASTATRASAEGRAPKSASCTPASVAVNRWVSFSNPASSSINAKIASTSAGCGGGEWLNSSRLFRASDRTISMPPKRDATQLYAWQAIHSRMKPRMALSSSALETVPVQRSHSGRMPPARRAGRSAR